jgi:ribosomal protein S5
MNRTITFLVAVIRKIIDNYIIVNQISTTNKNMIKATHFIITPQAGNVPRGIGFSKSPKKAIEKAKAKAWENLCRWDNAHGSCSSIGGEVTNMFNAYTGKHFHFEMDL